MRKRWLRTKEAATYSGLSPNTLRKYADEGLIYAARTEGGHRRYDRESIDEFFDQDKLVDFKVQQILESLT
ncbi:MerR family transcriptional regulator [Pseudodesulfovibrio sediminis]|uniref:HTH merR-type domain-containing protein n=1 Tax=Pseudodesulfovibrio sediminis TaxID=2810563 RepID=A0ABN6ELD3_9BACT|nr:hypothetical protein PSDVSF_00850 [Pseudodesulfovibrio sediminis]